MRIWLIKLGEPLPIDASNARLFRTGMLAEELARQGHEVVWWTSSVNHAEKKQRADQDSVVAQSDRYRIQILYGRMYHKNVSLQRIRHHREVACAFLRHASELRPPDAIVSALPTTEVCAAAVRYGRARGVPVLLDVRDLWPDLIAESAPRCLRWAARCVLAGMFREVRFACRNATGIIGVTRRYVEWALNYAARGWGPWDSEIPMAYKSAQLGQEAREAADRFWERCRVPSRPGQLVACFFGAFGDQFDMATVLRAARKLARKGRDIRFVLCGSGPKLGHFREMASGLDNVVFSGWIGAGEISALMERSSLGLAPYANRRNFVYNVANKPIEYWSAGLPIVYSLREGALYDILCEHNVGVTYTCGDPDDLTSVLCRLDDDRTSIEPMRRNALRLFRERYTSEIVLNKYIAHIQAVVETHHAAAPQT